jgi:trk system potassium uptake protein TrkH
MGGIGIVFIILAFFQSKKSLLFLGNTIGIENTNGNYKKMFLWVFAIYGLFIVAFTGIYYALGFTDLIKTGTFVIDTLTGGFSPTEQQMAQYVFPASKILMILLMTFGSVNFAFNYNLLTGKFRKMFTKEVMLFIAIIAVASLSIFLLTNLDFIDSLFHVVSMTSATGYYYVDIFSINGAVTAILITLVVIGGCSFSMSGGIRMSRIVTFLESIKSAILLAFVKGSNGEFTVEKEDDLEHQEQFPIVVSILLLIGLIVIFSIIFSTIGISFADSLLEIGSAFSTNGITLGAINVGMPLAYKWLVVAAMTIGRVEILTILLFLIPIVTYRSKTPELTQIETDDE